MRNFIMLHQTVYMVITFFGGEGEGDKQPKLGLSRLSAEVTRSYTDTRARVPGRTSLNK